MQKNIKRTGIDSIISLATRMTCCAVKYKAFVQLETSRTKIDAY